MVDGMKKKLLELLYLEHVRVPYFSDFAEHW